jgi:hypothetical protein
MDLRESEHRHSVQSGFHFTFTHKPSPYSTEIVSQRRGIAS